MAMRKNFTSLTVSGFQVFDKPTVIPLSRLTFLFGPNSAGKSAVEDALLILQDLLSDAPSTEQGFGEDIHWVRIHRLMRHWRRLSDAPLKLAKTMSLGATVLVDDWNLGDHLAENLGFEEQASIGSSSNFISVHYSFRLYEVEEDSLYGDELRANRDIDVEVNGVTIVKYVEWESLSVNFGHPLFLGFGQETVIEQGIINHPEYLISENGWVRLQINGFGLSERNDFSLDPLLDYWKEQNGEELPTSLTDAVGRLKSYFDNILRWKNFFHDQISLNVVTASRRVPHDDELVFLVDPSAGSATHRSSLEGFHLKTQGAEQLQRLARSIAAAIAVKDGCAIDDPFLNERPYDWHDSDEAEVFTCVNKSLLDHLFTERGYRLAYDYRLIVAPKIISDSSDASPESLNSSEVPIIIRVFLEDAESRRYTLAEVGSGLGYVLPVLVGLWAFEGGDECDHVLIQQPELHLHPALQANLADVFIEATIRHNLYSRIAIIETHSEHLLLRVLKRIRQTSKGTLLDSSLRITPNEVSVVYFDPKPDGTTKVKRLRIGEDGEFIDRWPRGFFTEREEDLFDDDDE